MNKFLDEKNNNENKIREERKLLHSSLIQTMCKSVRILSANDMHMPLRVKVNTFSITQLVD